MHVLAPIDGSDCSYRALEFAAEFVKRYEGRLHVVHFTDHESESTGEIMDRAEAILDDAGVVADPELLIDMELSSPRYGDRIGKDVLELVEEEGHDHVVMGHHGTGRLDRIIIGSAAETVVEAAETPATIVP